MSRIRNKDTKVELLVRKFLYSNGLRYRLKNTNLPCNPDLIFQKKKIAIFINGCFFHKHESCKNATTPETRKDFWTNKINQNIKRDKKNFDNLVNLGWKVIVVWECELEPKKVSSQIRMKTLENLARLIKNDSSY